MQSRRLARAVAAMVVLVLSACTDGSSSRPSSPTTRDDRVPTELVDATLTAPRTLSVGVDSCNKRPTAVVTEDDDVVEVTAFAPAPDPQHREDCLDVVTVRLDKPLGDRRVVDGSNGDNVTILDQTAP